MTPHRATIIAVFPERTQAQAAISDLRQANFGEEQIGLVSRSQTNTYAPGHEQVRERAGLPSDPTHSQWEQGAGIGGAAGAATGAGLGLAVAANLIPGIGPIIAGGTLMAILASTGAGAAIGTILGSLVGLGVPEEEAHYYDNEFKSGRTIVTVRADDRAAEAWNILIRHGAYDYERQPTAATVAGTGLQSVP